MTYKLFPVYAFFCVKLNWQQWQLITKEFKIWKDDHDYKEDATGRAEMERHYEIIKIKLHGD